MKTNVLKKLVVFCLVAAALLMNVTTAVTADATAVCAKENAVMVAEDLKPSPEPYPVPVRI